MSRRLVPEMLNAPEAIDLVEQTLPPPRQRTGTWGDLALEPLQAWQEPVLAFWVEAGVLARARLEDAASSAGRHALGVVVDRGERCVELMVRSNIGLAYWTARSILAHHTHPPLGVEDLVEVGVEALQHAVEMFDLAAGFKFSTYAINWIKNRQLDALNDALTPGVSRAWRTEVAAYRMWKARGIQQHGRAPSVAEAAQHFRVTPHRVAQWEQILVASGAALSLDEPAGTDEGSGRPRLHLLAGGRSADADTVADDIATRLGSALRRLPDRDRRVMCELAGIGRESPAPARLVADNLGIPVTQVAQIAAEAGARLRDMLGGQAQDWLVEAA